MRSGFALARTEGQCITRPRVTNDCARRVSPFAALPAMVSFLNPQPALSLGGGNRS